MRYYKKDIALEQIITSIILFFEWKYNISTKTLIHATKTLLEDLDRKKWTNLRMEAHMNPNAPKEHKKDFFNKLNEFPNFCKHSNKDKNDYLDTNIKLEEWNEVEIYFCIDMYSAIFEHKPPIFSIYMSYLKATWRYDYLFIGL